MGLIMDEEDKYNAILSEIDAQLESSIEVLQKLVAYSEQRKIEIAEHKKIKLEKVLLDE